MGIIASPRPTLRSLFANSAHVRVLEPRAARDEPFQPTPKSGAEDAALLEGGIGPFEVGPAEVSGFTHVLDDSQKSWPLLADEFRVAYLAHTSAALMARVERSMLPPEPWAYEGALEAFVPEGFREAERIAAAIQTRAVKLENCGATSAVQAVYEAIRQRRKEIERQVALRFSPAPGDFLLVDGSIDKARSPDGGYPALAGIVKSHARQYVSSEERVRAVMGMKAGWRSGAFAVIDRRDGKVSATSCYLRLHSRANAGPLYGLVRLEVPPGQMWIERIDEIAGWVLAERVPLSLPDPRFDRLLYPVRAVEMLLHARQPSDAAVRAISGV